MSVLSADEQELYDFAAASMPEWYTDDEKGQEFMGAAAKLLGAARRPIADWLGRQTFILTADGPTPTNPDFLGQHAIDRGTSRQNAEDNTALQVRLRNYPDALTRPALLAVVQAALTAAGVAGAPAMLELPRDGSYLGEAAASETGTGGLFTSVTGGFTFTPTVPFRTVPFLPVFPNSGRRLVFAGATSGGNNGTFATTDVVGNGVKYVNGSGVAGADAGVGWTLQKLTRHGVVGDGFDRAYATRGYRVGSMLPVIIIILPYGTTEALRVAVAEAVRQKRSAGIIAVIERREIP